MKTGAVFAGYRVESLVGRGGRGLVYRATDLSLERPVALKLIAPELAEDERFRARFLREPRLAATLDHPNVIPIDEAGGHPWLAKAITPLSAARGVVHRSLDCVDAGAEKAGVLVEERETREMDDIQSSARAP
jgi:serine/threonine protein kinase